MTARIHIRVGDPDNSASVWYPNVFDIQPDGTFCTKAICSPCKFANVTPQNDLPRSTSTWNKIAPLQEAVQYVECEPEECEVLMTTMNDGRKSIYSGAEHVHGKFFWIPEIVKLWDNTITNMNCYLHSGGRDRFGNENPIADLPPNVYGNDRRTFVEVIEGKFICLKKLES